MICANSYAELIYNSYEEDDVRFEDVGEHADYFLETSSDLEAAIGDALLELTPLQRNADYINSEEFELRFFKDSFLEAFVEEYGHIIDDDAATIKEIYENFESALMDIYPSIAEKAIKIMNEGEIK